MDEQVLRNIHNLLHGSWEEWLEGRELIGWDEYGDAYLAVQEILESEKSARKRARSILWTLQSKADEWKDRNMPEIPF